MNSNMPKGRHQSFPCAVCVLAGGRSSRLGRDKARLRLGRRTLLGHIRATVRKMGLPFRIIRCDLVPQCGPLGGVYTALRTSQADLVLFLACDMPFVSAELLQSMLKALHPRRQALFIQHPRAVGFPFLVRRTALALTRQQIARKDYSLQSLARKLKARILRPPRSRAGELFNINTPADWQKARKRGGPPGSPFKL